MKTTVTQRVVLGILSFFLLVYAAVQVYRFVKGQYKTETVYSYTVSENLRVNGVAIREEEVLEDTIDDGIATYLNSNGTKVSKGTPIAEIYDNRQDAENVRKLRELENKREMLEKAQDPGTTSFAHTDVLNRQIYSELGNVIDLVNSQVLTDLKDSSDQLLVLMNTKQIATGKQTDFNDAIEHLSTEEEYLKNMIKDPPRTIDAPKAGYFVSAIDGLEDAFDIDALSELTADKLSEFINSPQEVDSNKIGKLMTYQYWYYAAVVPQEDITNFKLGASVTLDFNIVGAEPVPAVISYINTDPELGNVVIFKCDYINDVYINLRVTQADVNFKNVTGLRVSSSAIRFMGAQKGVYTVLGNKLVFRPVTVIHEDQGFVLCRENDTEYSVPLEQFDEVVIEGTGLYNDKQLK